MADEFIIKTQLGKTLSHFFHSQFLVTPPYPSTDFGGKTVIVTGANVGLGFEASRHFYRLNCAKLILAVRTVSKGETAKEDIVRSVKQRSDGATAIEVWPLDLTSTPSTLAFAQRVKDQLPRVDAVVENAGINHPIWETKEGFETTIQVNVINTFLLALSLLPKLRETKQKFPDSSPHLEIVSSEVHRLSKFPEANRPDIYASLNDKDASSMGSRYNDSKLLEVLFVRELVARLATRTPSPSPPPVTITMVNPGLCKTSLARDVPSVLNVVLFTVYFIFGRTAEVGSRTLVAGASAGPASHGEFMSDCRNQEVEAWIYTDTGKRVQKKVFEQTMNVLEQRKPGIGAAVGV